MAALFCARRLRRNRLTGDEAIVAQALLTTFGDVKAATRPAMDGELPDVPRPAASWQHR